MSEVNFRIKKYPKGWVVEVQKKKWYGKTYWTHFISVSGIPSERWYDSTYEHAENSLIQEIKRNTIINSK